MRTCEGSATQALEATRCGSFDFARRLASLRMTLRRSEPSGRHGLLGHGRWRYLGYGGRIHRRPSLDPEREHARDEPLVPLLVHAPLKELVVLVGEVGETPLLGQVLAHGLALGSPRGDGLG